MNTTESVLLIILAAALALFLLLAIAIAIQILRLVHSLREIAKRAEKVVTSAEAVGRIFRKTSGSANLFEFIRAVSNIVAEHKNKKRES